MEAPRRVAQTSQVSLGQRSQCLAHLQTLRGPPCRIESRQAVEGADSRRGLAESFADAEAYREVFDVDLDTVGVVLGPTAEASVHQRRRRSEDRQPAHLDVHRARVEAVLLDQCVPPGFDEDLGGDLFSCVYSFVVWL